ncbi:MAG: YggS family pyridoxal phosphate-dependent enzyme [Endomicrobiales bacterium]|nr:YggS family pyridoxal phosphate-dependent enzyme [Endomicrobiales bacterium]
MSIKSNFIRIKNEIPADVKIVLAGKMKSVKEIQEVIDAGAEIIGENYVQEAEKIHQVLEDEAKTVKWHMIGSLQKNKINKALAIFDCIETIDSADLAENINKRAEKLNKEVSVLIEINIGTEMSKSGLEPSYEAVESLAVKISKMRYLKLEGLMTMGPRTGDPEQVRPYFKKTKGIFDRIKERNIPNVQMKYLSMGMSNSYKVAIEEGANIIRLGTVIFGERSCCLKT